MCPFQVPFILLIKAETESNTLLKIFLKFDFIKTLSHKMPIFPEQQNRQKYNAMWMWLATFCHYHVNISTIRKCIVVVYLSNITKKRKDELKTAAGVLWIRQQSLNRMKTTAIDSLCKTQKKHCLDWETTGRDKKTQISVIFWQG